MAARSLTTSQGRAEPPTLTERAEAGRAARKRTPRSSHAEPPPTDSRPDPIGILEAQAASRVAELVPIRYGRMLTSPFAFYRGAAAVMAADLSVTPTSGFRTQLCGDAHLGNFGLYASPERRIVFDINDFDETAPGPWEWDVKRLAASIEIASRANGFSDRERRRVVTEAVAEYRNAMAAFAEQGNLAVWYARVDASAERVRTLDRETRRHTEAALAKAQERGSDHAVEQLTEVVGGERRIVSRPPLVQPLAELMDGFARDEVQALIHSVLDGYAASLPADTRHLLGQFRPVDAGRKVVGVGSVGTRAWIALLLGPHGDPLVLQVKEAQRSVLEPFGARSGRASQGRRVVEGQRLMQAVSDIFLGWHRLTGIDGVVRDYYVRQLRDGKGSLPVERMAPVSMAVYGRTCAWTLARAHARSGDRVAIAAYLGRSVAFDVAIAAFAQAYADLNERDHAALADAVRAGRIAARDDL